MCMNFLCKSVRVSLSTAYEIRQGNLLIDLTLIICVMLCSTYFVVSASLHGSISSVCEVLVGEFEEIS